MKIIAEIGINHNGNIKIAKKLIDFAKKAGANCVKFQSYKTDDLIEVNEKLMKYQSKNMSKKMSQYTMLKKCELSDSEFVNLKKYCKKKSIEFLSTPYSEERANFLIRLGMKKMKIASTDTTNINFISYLLKKNIKLIISTGATTLSEIDMIMKKINLRKNKKKISILHCTSYYPANEEILNLDTIIYLREKYNVEVGYSDHSDSNITGALAVINGASIIEKHITLSKKMWGPDHKASMEFDDFKKYVENINYAKIAKGNMKKKLSTKELIVKKQMQKSLIYKKSLNPGDFISSKLITSKRPATGISPLFIYDILNKKLKHKVYKNKQIKFSDFK